MDVDVDVDVGVSDGVDVLGEFVHSECFCCHSRSFFMIASDLFAYYFSRLIKNALDYISAEISGH